MFKPYRLINDLELAALQKRLDSQLHHWNNTYAVLPLISTLNRISTSPMSDSLFDLSDVLKTDCIELTTIKYSLLGDESKCFNNITKTLFNTLFDASFKPKSHEWFYPGSPALVLTLRCAHHSMNLYFHPQWVLNALPPQIIPNTALISLHHALADQSVDLQANIPIALKLADIVALTIGDVIKTEHLITEPIPLTHQKKLVCSVELGAKNSYKSVQIVRKL